MELSLLYYLKRRKPIIGKKRIKPCDYPFTETFDNTDRWEKSAWYLNPLVAGVPECFNPYTGTKCAVPYDIPKSKPYGQFGIVVKDLICDRARIEFYFTSREVHIIHPGETKECIRNYGDWMYVVAILRETDKYYCELRMHHDQSYAYLDVIEVFDKNWKTVKSSYIGQRIRVEPPRPFVWWHVIAEYRLLEDYTFKYWVRLRDPKHGYTTTAQGQFKYPTDDDRMAKMGCGIPQAYYAEGTAYDEYVDGAIDYFVVDEPQNV